MSKNKIQSLKVLRKITEEMNVGPFDLIKATKGEGPIYELAKQNKDIAKKVDEANDLVNQVEYEEDTKTFADYKKNQGYKPKSSKGGRKEYGKYFKEWESGKTPTSRGDESTFMSLFNRMFRRDNPIISYVRLFLDIYNIVMRIKSSNFDLRTFSDVEDGAKVTSKETINGLVIRKFATDSIGGRTIYNKYSVPFDNPVLIGFVKGTNPSKLSAFVNKSFRTALKTNDSVVKYPTYNLDKTKSNFKVGSSSESADSVCYGLAFRDADRELKTTTIYVTRHGLFVDDNHLLSILRLIDESNTSFYLGNPLYDEAMDKIRAYWALANNSTMTYSNYFNDTVLQSKWDKRLNNIQLGLSGTMGVLNGLKSGTNTRDRKLGVDPTYDQGLSYEAAGLGLAGVADMSNSSKRRIDLSNTVTYGLGRGVGEVLGRKGLNPIRGFARRKRGLDQKTQSYLNPYETRQYGMIGNAVKSVGNIAKKATGVNNFKKVGQYNKSIDYMKKMDPNSKIDIVKNGVTKQYKTGDVLRQTRIDRGNEAMKGVAKAGATVAGGAMAYNQFKNKPSNSGVTSRPIDRQTSKPLN